MRRLQIHLWSHRYQATGVYLGMALVVVALDVVEVAGGFDVRVLVKVTQIAPEIRVIHDSPHIAFEMDVIHWVKSQ